MGKCKVVSHDGDGLYTVQMLPDISIIEADIAKLEADLLALDTVEIVALESAYTAAVAVTNSAQSDVDAAIVTFAASPTEENQAAINAAIGVLGEAVKAEAAAKQPYDTARARKLSIEKRIARLDDAIVTPDPVQVWCTDLSDGQGGRGLFAADEEAGTIELVGEDSNGVILQPHFDDLGFYDSSRDGLSTPSATFTPASYYYNRAMLPSWQKWEYGYRPGIITGITEAAFTVRLDPVKSDEQSPFIPVNDLDGGTITGVPADYMDCDSIAFAIDDHVVVNTTWDAERVRTDTIIGFVDNPKPCQISGFNYEPVVVGGTSPGTKPWQNVEGGPGSWGMTTPVLSDVITDGTGNNMQDWKGYLAGGEQVLAQWIYRGPSIYIDGNKMAVVPTFSLSQATGDPWTGSTVPSGFYAAWVTKDNQYIYAVPYEQSGTRHVMRKTNTAELTGGAYNASTLPDGWEVSAAFGPADYTDFVRHSLINMNESGTEGRAMDRWVHGAKRTPQMDPGDGPWEYAVSGYEDEWVEETVMAIATPSAATISAAGITVQYLGKQDDFIYVKSSEGYQETSNSGAFLCGIFPKVYYWGSTYDAIGGSISLYGKERIVAGYEGDTVGYTWLEGFGTRTSSQSWEASYHCVSNNLETISREENRDQSTTVGGYGLRYYSDFFANTYPRKYTEIITWTFTYTDDGSSAGSNQSETREYYEFEGAAQQIATNDKTYRFAYDELWTQQVYNRTGSPSFPPDTPTGTYGAGFYTEQHYVIRFGGEVIPLERTFTSTPFSTSPSHVQREDLSGYSNPFAGSEADGLPADENSTLDIPTSIGNITGGTTTPLGNITILPLKIDRFEYAASHVDHYIATYKHRYNDLETLVYASYLSGGDLSTLDTLDNGTGTEYRYPHVANN